MKRNPCEVEKIKYYKNIHIKKCFPILYTECCKCKMEYKFESMYECSYMSHIIDWIFYKHGCTECFSSKDEFRKYLENTGTLLTEDNYYEAMDIANLVSKYK